MTDSVLPSDRSEWRELATEMGLSLGLLAVGSALGMTVVVKGPILNQLCSDAFSVRGCVGGIARVVNPWINATAVVAAGGFGVWGLGTWFEQQRATGGSDE